MKKIILGPCRPLRWPIEGVQPFKLTPTRVEGFESDPRINAGPYTSMKRPMSNFKICSGNIFMLDHNCRSFKNMGPNKH